MDANSTPEITPEMLEANPLLAICLLLFTGVFLSAAVGVFLSWGYLFICYWKRRTILPVASWKPRPWGFIEILIAIGIMLATQVLAVAIAIPVLGLDREALAGGEAMPLSLAAVVSACYFLTICIVSGWIMLRYRTGISELGWSLKGFPRNVLIGIVAGLVFLPFMFALNAIVAITSEVPYEHPVLDAMKSDGTLLSFGLACFSAAIVAPIAEEFLFRVLLQGWLQSIPFVTPIEALVGRLANASQPLGSSGDAALAAAGNLSGVVTENAREDRGSQGRFNESAFPSPQNAATEASDFREGGGSTDALSAFRPDQADPFRSANAANGGVAGELTDQPAPIWPSLLAGTLFGLAHWGYGLSFIPLIALGIVLGLLYRATKSIWPCIVLHFMLNASSMAALGISVYMERVAAGGP